MAERLTERKSRKGITYTIQPHIENNLVIHKLGLLEDIMEKFGVETIEELSKILSYLSGRFINTVYSLKHKFDSYEDKIKYLANKKGQYYEELYETKKDRDTWQKACELACQIIISGCCDCIEDTTDWDSAVEEWKEYNGIETYGIGIEELLGYLLEQAKKEGNDERN